MIKTFFFFTFNGACYTIPVMYALNACNVDCVSNLQTVTLANYFFNI